MADTKEILVPRHEGDPTEVFDVLEEVGEGTFGKVVKAVDRRDKSIVAIKIINLETADDITQVLNEIRILKTCQHDNVVSYKSTFERNKRIWIVMEYCTASLSDFIDICNTTLTEDQIAAVMKQCLSGLSYLHAAKKIHRDIKAANILITNNGECKLADFGVSAQLDKTWQRHHTSIGTPYFMAPEVIQGADYDNKCDIWSLGITCIELATGDAPLSREMPPLKALCKIPFLDPPKLPNPDKWSKEFNEFIAACLQKKPKDRPSAEVLLKTSGFIAKAKSKAVIVSLVDRCMPAILEDRKRTQEVRDDENKKTRPLNSSLAASQSGVSDSGDESSGHFARSPRSGFLTENSGTMKSRTGVSVGAPEQKEWTSDDFFELYRTKGAQHRKINAHAESFYKHQSHSKLGVTDAMTIEQLQDARKQLVEGRDKERKQLEDYYHSLLQQVDQMIGHKDKEQVKGGGGNKS